MSPAPVHLVMRGSARDLLRQHEVPEHVADMLEEEDIYTPQTLMDLDDAMVNALGLKLGEKIRLKQAINFAKSCVASDDAGGFVHGNFSDVSSCRVRRGCTDGAPPVVSADFAGPVSAGGAEGSSPLCLR